jgi:hypothetical protein
MKKLLAICVLIMSCQVLQAQTRMTLNSHPLTGSYRRLTRDSVNLLFSQIKSLPEVEYRYTRGGCDYRAHATYLLLKKMGVTSFKIWSFASAKVFLSGNQYHNKLLRVNDKINLSTEQAYYRTFDPVPISNYVYWGYHVAPVLLAQNGIKTDTLVIDPALYERPIDYKEWTKASLQADGSSYIIFLNGDLISFQTESQIDKTPSEPDLKKKTYCQDCSGNNIITGVFWNDTYSISQKWIEQSLAKGRIFIEYYKAEIEPLEQKLARITPNPNKPESAMLISELAKRKRFISAESGDEVGLVKLPQSYQERYNKYVDKATAILFK